jgi:hypothetical protein
MTNRYIGINTARVAKRHRCSPGEEALARGLLRMAAASKIQAIARSSASGGEKLVGAANAMADLLERLGYSDVSAEYDKLREGVIQQ